MRALWILIPAVVAGSLFMGIPQARSERMVPAGARIALVAGERQSGRWDAPDLSLKYNYSTDSATLSLDGEVRFADKIVYSFIHVSRFHAKLYWLGRNGRVIASKGLYSTGHVDADQVMKFRAVVPVPQGARAFAFGYSGMARGDGSQPVETTFWEDPTRRVILGGG